MSLLSLYEEFICRVVRLATVDLYLAQDISFEVREYQERNQLLLLCGTKSHFYVKIV
jgi:hypothetical protein